MTSEKVDDYSYCLRSYEKYFKMIPETIMTDQEKALDNSISRVWPSANHVFCIFHIFRNIQQNIGILLF